MSELPPVDQLRQQLRAIKHRLDFSFDPALGLVRQDVGDAMRSLSLAVTDIGPSPTDDSEIDAATALPALRALRDQLEAHTLVTTDQGRILQLGGALHSLSRGIACLVVSIAREAVR